MVTFDSIKKRLSDLAAEGRSGIVAFNGFGMPLTECEPFWETHNALVYIHPLDTLVAYSLGTFYQNGTNILPEDRILQDFIGEDNDQQIEELLEGVEMSEQEYLDLCTAVLLNDMAHDDSECPDLDMEDFDNRYGYPTEEEEVCPDNHYTITGVADIAEDIKAVRAAIEKGEELSVPVLSGHKKFIFSLNPFGKYTLSTLENAEILDSDSGEKITVQERVQLLRALDWRTFYAKCRLFIYWNWGGVINQ